MDKGTGGGSGGTGGGGGALAFDSTPGPGFLSNPAASSAAPNSLLFSRRPLKRPSPAIDFTLNFRADQSPTRSPPMSLHLEEVERPTSADHKQINEMDFFSQDRKRGTGLAGGTTGKREDEEEEEDEEPIHEDDRRHGEAKLPTALGIKKEDLSINTVLHLHTTNTGSDQSTVDDGVSSNEDGHSRRHQLGSGNRSSNGAKNGSESQLAAMQAELARMVEENHRLRGMLSQATANYNALQMHLMSLMQQQRSGSPAANAAADNEGAADKMEVAKQQHHGRRDGASAGMQFLELRPVATDGTDEPSNSSTEVGSPIRPGSASVQNNNTAEVASLDYRLLKTSASGNNISEMMPFDHDKAAAVAAAAGDHHMMIGDDSGEGWIPNKLPKFTPTKNPTATATAVEQAQEATMRKARVSVRARSEAPMITDGCQWRKYGQKMAKGNPCPRAYYRCTMAAGCPVRKQVQRCADDRSILITTYEGTHNHPLPPAAVAMASTTSAAASMLLSGSMSSADGLMNPNFLARTLLPCSSNMATISASAPFPTVTLDLTTAPNPLQYQQRPNSATPPTLNSAQFPAGIVPFASSGPEATVCSLQPASGNAAAAPPQLPQIFGQALYGTTQSKFFGHHMSSSHDAAAAIAEQLPKTALQAISTSQPQTSFADTVTAATAAITSDPNFTAALAAAISSIIGGQQQQQQSAGTQNSGGSHSKATSSSEELTR